MGKLTSIGLLLAGVGLGVFMTTSGEAAPKTEPMVGHMVYFKLKDPTPENREKLVRSCYDHLKGHAGEVYFGAGVLAEEYKREVNDRDWDVGLHVVFKTRADHDNYQDRSERHTKFIETGKATWAKVRVFDSLIEGK